MKKLYLTAILAGLLFSAWAQNVNLQVRVTRLERNFYNDCNACGDPDPTWKVRGTHNGTGATNYGPFCWHYAEMGFTLWDITDYQIMNVLNTNATTFTLGFDDAFEKSCSNNNCTYESYNFFTCFPSVYGDSRRCQNNNLLTENFRNFSPCQWHTVWGPWCGDYRFEYSFYWSFNAAPTIAIQPQANNNLCLGTSTTLAVAATNDPYGWNMGQNFQWQVSNSTACPGTGWVNVLGANASTFTPPQTPGTRLYRCIVTSNCTQDFTSNSTTSNCAVVTYNPMGSPGDLPPDIVSGICGSTVLPGSTHVLGVLTPPNAGAPVGLTGYTWGASGGSPTNATGNTFTWTAPTAPGTYNINLTYNDNCPQPDAQANVCVVIVGSATCDFAYVATYGVDSTYAGGPDLPYKSVAYAISQLSGHKYIRIASGVYFETVPLQLENDLTIEGGYKVSGNIWTKTNADSTVLVCSGSQVINGDVAHRVGFIADNDDNWELQDLVITTTDVSDITANNKGYSNYGILALNGSSGFDIVRCKIYAGDAAMGAPGTTPAGAGGAGGGGGGGNGGSGSTQGCNGQGSSGGTGLAGNGGAGGGGGGGSCGGGGCNIFGCNASGCTAAPGQTGANGAAGSGFAAGIRPPTPGVASPFYVPAGQATAGNNGFGGGGGGGGGGGDIGTCCTCSCGSGSPSGGTGGTGGGGGLPGDGGFGGGGSFGIYASGAGTQGSITTSSVNAGTFGTGGDGAAGQAGGTGANGANGVSHGGCDGGNGGNGGKGGNGGQGGRGQDGANGLSQNVVAVGGASITGSSTAVPNAYTIAINYQNSKACINSEIEMTKNSGVWTFPSGMSVVNDLRDYPAGFPVSSFNASSSPVKVYVTNPGVDYDLTVNGNQFAQYLKLADDNRALPVISSSSSTICIDGIDTLTATHWGSEVEYEWIVYQATNANSPLYQSTLPSPSINFFGFAPGIYNVRYRVRESCCGWSIPVFDTIRIAPLPTQFTVAGGGSYCPGDPGSIVTLSGSEPGVTYILYFAGTAVDTVIGTGSPIAFAPQTATGNYTVTAVRFADCEIAMFGAASIDIYPAPVAYNVSGSDTLCTQGGTTFATVTLSGSELGVSYQLIKNGSIPVGAALPGSTQSIQFTGISTPGIYTVVATNNTSGCKSTMNDSAVIFIAPPPTAYNVTGGGSYCNGDSGVVIGLSGSDTGTVYLLYQAGAVLSAPGVNGTGNPISFEKVGVGSFYKVKAISQFGCEAWMNDSAIVKVNPLPAINAVSVKDINCYGDADGQIVITASSTAPPLSYSIDSGATFVNTSTFSNLGTGSYYVVVKDANNCPLVYAANPAVVSQPSALSTQTQGKNPNCNGDHNGFAEVTAAGGTAPYQYAWNTNPPYTGYLLSNVQGNTLYIVTVTDNHGCVAIDSITLSEPSVVTINAIPANVKCFKGNDGTVTVTASGGSGNYTFFLNGVIQPDSIFTGLTAGLYTASVQDENGCLGAVSFTITEPQAFTVNAGPDLISVRGQTVTLNGSASSANGIIGYWWMPDVHLSCTACQVSNANPDSNQTYILMAMDGDSCVGYDSMNVIVKYKIDYFIPTAFTPQNNDKLNDYFEFEILGANNAEVSIFNRWGERVYYNAAQHNGIQNNGDAWDGTKDGKQLPPDTYVYQLKVKFFDSSEEDISGTITLMK